MSRFKKGQPKPPNSGRKPGSLNKKTLLKTQVLLAEREFHPVDRIIAILPELAPRDRANVLLELLQYLEPKKKEKELDDTPEPPQEDTSGIANDDITSQLKAVK